MLACIFPLLLQCGKIRWLESNVIILDITKRVNKGYHGWDGQTGTTMMPVALSEIFLLKVFKMTATGGNT